MVLQRFTEQLLNSSRPYDFVGRYGGEEFVVCLPGADISQSESVAERMRSKVEEMKMVLPKMSGKKTAERLQPLYPQMKVIYMSGYTDDAIVHHGVLAAGLNFLEKPFTPVVLARKVRVVLDQGN